MPIFGNSKGFTLIELIVVIAIIGLLASIVLVSINSTRAKARDSKRKDDIRQIILALTMYYDANSNFPSISYGGNCGTALNGSDAVSTALASAGFLAKMPMTNPNNGTCGGAYYSGSFAADAGGCGTPAGIAVLTDLENADTNCITWSCGWYKPGSYCNKRYVQILYK